MATKSNKAKNLSNRKKPTSKPQQLIQLPALKFVPMPCMSNLGKVKSWLKPNRCNKSDEHRWPQLHLLNSNDSSNNSSTSDNLHYNFIVNPFISPVSQQPNIGSCWRILKLENINNRSRPSWSHDGPFKFVAKSTNDHDTSGAIRVELTFISSPALMVLCLNEHDERAWIRYECTTVDPFDAKGQCMQFNRVIAIEDKIYTLSLQGTLAVIEDVDSRLVITGMSKSRAVPIVSSRYFKDYFVEMNGEILLVFLIFKRSIEVVDEVEVFRLCFVNLKWIKVEKLQDKALFLDQCGIWANSSHVGCRGNCVYFTQRSNNGWWVYDMESCCISPAMIEK